MIRRAFTMRLKPDSLAEYKRHHDHIWPELVEEIDKSGIASITTFQRGLDLFLVSEISDPAAWDRLWNSEIHRRWGEVMRPLMHLREDGIVETEEWTEVFHFAGPHNGQQRDTQRAREGEVRRETVSGDPAAENNSVEPNGATQRVEESAPTAGTAASSTERKQSPKKQPAKKAAKKAAASVKRASRNGKGAAGTPKKKMKKAKAASAQKAANQKASAKKKAAKKTAPKKSAKKAKRPAKKKAARR